jgi:hypothetical protein
MYHGRLNETVLIWDPKLSAFAEAKVGHKMPSVSSEVKFLPQLMRNMGIPNTSKNPKDAKMRLMLQKGFQRSDLSACLVQNPIKGVCFPNKIVTSKGLWQCAIEQNGPGHHSYCSVKTFNYSILIMVIGQRTFSYNSFLVQVSLQFIVEKLPANIAP